MKSYLRSYNELVKLIQIKMRKKGADLDFSLINIPEITDNLTDEEILKVIYVKADYHPLNYFSPLDERFSVKDFYIFAFNPLHDLYYGINGITREIFLLELYEDELYEHEKCASTLENFINALALAQDFETNFYLDKLSYNDDTKRRVIREKCAAIAGGEEFYDYYNLLIP